METSYSISYFDSLNGKNCSSSIVPADDCMSGSCSHVFYTSSSRCSQGTNIIVTVELVPSSTTVDLQLPTPEQAQIGRFLIIIVYRYIGENHIFLHYKLKRWRQ